MKVWDVHMSIYDRLHELPRHRYLCAMWILCGELRSLYAQSLASEEESLMSATLDLVRKTAIGEGVMADTARAADLVGMWRKLIDEQEEMIFPGQLNTCMTFRNLTAEIAGLAEEYYASERLINAVVERWREPRNGRLRVNIEEEVDEASPMARTLDLFRSVVAAIAELPDNEWDPVKVRARILG
jgi:hypothetical protein